MKFFYADSLDQTSLVYDLINEEYIQNKEGLLTKRNPYKDDKYFHEVFDSVQYKNGHYQSTICGYHGLLLSLHSYYTNYVNKSSSSLPTIFRFPPQNTKKESKILFDPQYTNFNFRKKNRKKKHVACEKLPIIADSGAFYYKDQTVPPYNTLDVVSTYKHFQCTYGVALDHIPNHAKIADEKNKYCKRTVELQKKIMSAQKKLLLLDQQLSLFEDDSTTQRKSNLKNQIDAHSSILESIEAEHPQKIKQYEMERDFRWNLSLENAKEFLSEHKKQNASFIPIGTAHGWDAESYRQSAMALQQMGYKYIAIGGLVPIASDQERIKYFVEEISNSLSAKIPLHLFGIKSIKPKEIQYYHSLNVRSFDTSSPMTQSMKDSRSNYWSDEKNYINLRIPKIDASRIIDSSIVEGHVSRQEAKKQEALCLTLVRALDSANPPNEHDVLSALEEYAAMYKKPFSQAQRELTLETLRDKPWHLCTCRICLHFGVEVMIFRGTVRNKARGFHNIWKLGQWVRQGDT